MKNCIKCNEKKELNNFYKSVKHKDGYFNICKNCLKNKYLKNKEKILKYQKEYILKNKEKILKYNKEYVLQNKEKYKNHYILNKEQYKERQKKYNKKQYKENIQFKLKSMLRSRFYSALIKGYKMKSILELISCSIEELKLYLQHQFKLEMTWENHGKIWEIDHIIGCYNFDLTKLKEQQKCFHYTNLQPLFKTTKIAESFGYTDQIGNKNKTK